MVAQWNIGGAHPAPSSGGVYMMKSADGIKFSPMFGNYSLDWSDTKNVMFFEPSLGKYIAYIRIDNGSPANPTPCRDPWLNPGRRVGRCVIAADQLHDWALAGCTSKGSIGDIECSKGPKGARDCSAWGEGYEPFACSPTDDMCAGLGTCGGAHAECNGTACVVSKGGEPGPLCHKPPPGQPGTATALSFDEQDPGSVPLSSPAPSSVVSRC